MSVRSLCSHVIVNISNTNIRVIMILVDKIFDNDYRENCFAGSGNPGTEEGLLISL